jgi:hypothetical protein
MSLPGEEESMIIALSKDEEPVSSDDGARE